MNEKFVFFHVGEDLSTARMLVKSIRKTNPNAEVIQCTDLVTAQIDGVSHLYRFDGNRDNLMTFRLSAFSKLQLDQPAIYLDTDMLVVRPFAPSAILGKNDVMLCRRDFDRDSLHSGSQRGVHFPEHHNRPIGEVYPYLACATIARNADIWGELLTILKGLDDRFHRWYGDQEAMRIWADRRTNGVIFLHESHFACLPEKSAYLNEAYILHFKGVARKSAMLENFRSLMTDRGLATHRSHRSLDTSDNPGLGQGEISYVIMTPPPNPKSAGISYLNALADYLRVIGKKVIQLFAIYPNEQLHVWGSTETPKKNHWIQPWQGSWVKVSPGDLSRILDPHRSIVIHGENQHFKWYEGLNVVRYYLHTIGGLQKKGVPRAGEFKLAWHPMFCPDADYILSKSMVRADLEKAERISVVGRTLDLTYLGKAWIHDKNASRIQNTIELTRAWPDNDEEYFYLLSKTRRLFTYDAVTSVLDDAIVMGAMPIIVSTAPFSKESWEVNLEPEMRGCYCFSDDDYDELVVRFSERREKFISTAREKNARYLSGLREFCERAEGYFSGKTKSEIHITQSSQ